MLYREPVRPLFRLDDLVVTDARLDIDVPQRCRLAVDRAGSTWVVEDLGAEHLEDDVAWQLFVADAVLRIDGGTCVGTVAGAPVARTPLAPGLDLDELLDVIGVATGSTPPAAVIALAGAFAAAAGRARVPWLPVPVLWLGVDGQLGALGSFRRNDLGVRRGRASQWRYLRPEGIRGATSVDETSIVYVVGVVLHCLVHGCLPWGDPLPPPGSGKARTPPTMFDVVRAMRARERSVGTPSDDPLASLARACTAHDAVARPPLAQVIAALQPASSPLSAAWLPVAAALCPDRWREAVAVRDELAVLTTDDAGLPSFSSTPLDPTPHHAWLRTPPPDGVFWSARPPGPAPRALPG
jgi:hypothetical protein